MKLYLVFSSYSPRNAVFAGGVARKRRAEDFLVHRGTGCPPRDGLKTFSCAADQSSAYPASA